MSAYRVGMIVPSSNTTMETEVPAMLRARREIAADDFTFHSARMRMKNVSAAELAAMDLDSERCAAELADADVDVLTYACLVAIMSQGAGYHRDSETRLAATGELESGRAVPVVSSAGALIEGLHHLGARKISVITPYMRPLTAMVCDYIEAEGVEVLDSISLEVPDNLAVGRLDPQQLIDLSTQLKIGGADAVVISACVQMPSLPVLDAIQQRMDVPVLSAASATVWQLLGKLGLPQVVPRAGALLAG